MKSLKFILKTLKDTRKLGLLLGSHANPGDIICLDGDLGAGKTTLSQAIAAGLEIPPDCYVTSPSFAILHEYTGRMVMYHMDFYRLESSEEVEDLGFEEYFYLEGLTVIEWANRAVDILPKERMSFTLSLKADLSRAVTLTAPSKFKELFDRIQKEFQVYT